MQGQSLVRIAKTNPDADQSAYARSDFSQEAFGWSALESWRAGKFLYIRAPQAELYDLVADPGAGHNLAQTSKATLAALAAHWKPLTATSETCVVNRQRRDCLRVKCRSWLLWDMSVCKDGVGVERGGDGHGPKG